MTGPQKRKGPPGSDPERTSKYAERNYSTEQAGYRNGHAFFLLYAFTVNVITVRQVVDWLANEVKRDIRHCKSVGIHHDGRLVTGRAITGDVMYRMPQELAQ